MVTELTYTTADYAYSLIITYVLCSGQSRIEEVGERIFPSPLSSPSLPLHIPPHPLPFLPLPFPPFPSHPLPSLPFPLPLEVGYRSYGVWGSAVSFPSGVWGGVPAEIVFGAS